MSNQPYAPVGKPISEHLAVFALRLSHEVGPERAARLIGITRGTLGAVIGGFAVSATTEARVRQAANQARRSVA